MTGGGFPSGVGITDFGPIFAPPLPTRAGTPLSTRVRYVSGRAASGTVARPGLGVRPAARLRSARGLTVGTRVTVSAGYGRPLGYGQRSGTAAASGRRGSVRWSDRDQRVRHRLRRGRGLLRRPDPFRAAPTAPLARSVRRRAAGRSVRAPALGTAAGVGSAAAGGRRCLAGDRDVLQRPGDGGV